MLTGRQRHTTGNCGKHSRRFYRVLPVVDDSCQVLALVSAGASVSERADSYLAEAGWSSATVGSSWWEIESFAALLARACRFVIRHTCTMRSMAVTFDKIARSAIAQTLTPKSRPAARTTTRSGRTNRPVLHSRPNPSARA